MQAERAAQAAARRQAETAWAGEARRKADEATWEAAAGLAQPFPDASELLESADGICAAQAERAAQAAARRQAEAAEAAKAEQAAKEARRCKAALEGTGHMPQLTLPYSCILSCKPAEHPCALCRLKGLHRQRHAGRRKLPGRRGQKES